MVYHYSKPARKIANALRTTPPRGVRMKKGRHLSMPPLFSSSPRRGWKPVLHARVRTVSDFHATVLVVADAIGGCNGRAGFAEALRADRAIRDAASGQVAANRVVAAIRQADVVRGRTRTAGVAGEHDMAGRATTGGSPGPV